MSLTPAADDIVIVSAGAILPGAMNVDEFFDNMFAGRSFVCDLSKAPDQEHRQLYQLLYDTDRAAAERSYTLLGAPVDRRKIAALAAQYHLPPTLNFHLYLMVLDVVRQCTQSILPDNAITETDFIFGTANMPVQSTGYCMDKARQRITAHSSAALADLLLPEYARSHMPFDQPLTIYSQLAEQVRQHYHFGGVVVQVDAACASSLAALYVAVQRLRSGAARYAVVGGADDSLGSVMALVSFSRLGVLAEKSPAPFDKTSDGMSIGEGAAAFLLTTLAEAQRQKMPVMAVIKGVGGSSDGRYGGMTEPTLAGQMLCYERAYDSKTPPAMAYIEAHGTGTKVGDRTELDSLNQFFGGQQVPIGSAKGSIGHTMAGAGAIGLLRALGVLRHGMTPPSPYYQQPLDAKKIPLAPKQQSARLANSDVMNVGVSSFGFGGANFHVWLQAPPAAEKNLVLMTSAVRQKHDVVLCSESEATIADVAHLFRNTSYRLPPKIWPLIDKIQLLGVLLTEKMLRAAGIDPARLERRAVHVLAGSTFPLDLMRDTFEQQMAHYALCYIESKHPDRQAEVTELRKRIFADTTATNEQSVPGSLTSLVAARVTKAFDFQGINFNMDADYASGLLALETARGMLAANSGAAIVLDVVKQAEPQAGLRMPAMRCQLIASLPFALEHNLPIRAKLGTMTLSRGQDAAA
jgi:acyl transferase domain-containing protein